VEPDLPDGLHLQQDRISDLVAEVDTEARSLCRTERELLRMAEGCGITRAEVIDRLFGRELDLDWIGEAASLSDRGWCALNASGSLVTVPSRSRRRVSEKRTRSRGASRPLAHSFSFLGRSGLCPRPLAELEPTSLSASTSISQFVIEGAWTNSLHGRKVQCPALGHLRTYDHGPPPLIAVRCPHQDLCWGERIAIC
jgi:hypothetical protein